MMDTTLLGRRVTAEGLQGEGTVVALYVKHTWDYWGVHVLVEGRGGTVEEFNVRTVTLVPAGS